jgi:hypothetical protein
MVRLLLAAGSQEVQGLASIAFQRSAQYEVSRLELGVLSALQSLGAACLEVS